MNWLKNVIAKLRIGRVKCVTIRNSSIVWNAASKRLLEIEEGDGRYRCSVIEGVRDRHKVTEYAGGKQKVKRLRPESVYHVRISAAGIKLKDGWLQPGDPLLRQTPIYVPREDGAGDRWVSELSSPASAPAAFLHKVACDVYDLSRVQDCPLTLTLDQLKSPRKRTSSDEALEQAIRKTIRRNWPSLREAVKIG
jgi:hypothetical protein